MGAGDELRYDGKVVVVTGAGGGLGREYALLFASRGASVVVNDLGGDTKGGGKSSAAADKVVQEIISAGGKAVANYDSVEDGDKIVETALSKFGRIDILINNAGILRDRSIARISDLDWDLIHRVHLRGSFLVTRAAWPHMKKQGYGRIIMTSSAAGIYGNFGQTNYSAAKLGLLGMSNTLAKEGVKYNIRCNTIAPLARSRMTEELLPEEIKPLVTPVTVAPLVAYLCHEDCEDTGGVFEVGAGWVGKLRWQRTKGVMCSQGGQSISPESVRDNWEEICNFDEGSTNPTTTAESMSGILESVQNEMEKSKQPKVTGDETPDAAIGYNLPPTTFNFTSRDVILYALGVGVSTAQPDYLKFLFEMNDEFCTLPSFGVIPAFSALPALMSGNVPGMGRINPTQILHGEQYLEMFKPFPTEGKLTSEACVTDVLDKGSGAAIITDVETFDEGGELICRNQFTTFAVGAGGFGGKRSSDKAVPTEKPPKRAPDASMKEKTGIDQAAIYRLSGDNNPLHIDPSFAAMGGFKTPILHGLCSFGFMARHVLKTYANNDVTKFKAIKVRFSKPVLPGQTIQTDMWKEGNRIYCEAKVVENGNVCISGAYVDLTDAAPQSTTEPSSTSGGLKTDLIFEEIGKRLAGDPSQAKKVNGIFQYIITSDGSVASKWTLDLKNSPPSVYRGEPTKGKADVTITVSDSDMADMAAGKLNGQSAFMQGKIKVKGNMMILQKAASIFQTQSKM